MMASTRSLSSSARACSPLVASTSDSPRGSVRSRTTAASRDRRPPQGCWRWAEWSRCAPDLRAPCLVIVTRLRVWPEDHDYVVVVHIPKRSEYHRTGRQPCVTMTVETIVSASTRLRALLLPESAPLLEEAQALANLGSWAANLQTGESGVVPGVLSHLRRRVRDADRQGDGTTARPPRTTGSASAPGREPIAERSCPLHESDHRVVHADGSLRWVLGRTRITRDAQGRAVRLTGVVQDVTERQQALDWSCAPARSATVRSRPSSSGPTTPSSAGRSRQDHQLEPRRDAAVRLRRARGARSLDCADHA